MNWREEAKHLKQSFMVLKDQYSALAIAAGFTPVGFWGDPAEAHEHIAACIKSHVEALREIAKPFDRGDGGENLTSFSALSTELGRRQRIASVALNRGASSDAHGVEPSKPQVVEP